MHPSDYESPGHNYFKRSVFAEVRTSEALYPSGNFSTNHGQEPVTPDRKNGPKGNFDEAIKTGETQIQFDNNSCSPNQWLMTQACFFDQMFDMTRFRPEQAGLLFGPTNEPTLVTHYVRDEQGESSSASFSLDANFLNEKIRVHRQSGLEMKGIVHSHPKYFNRLSDGDIHYISRLFENPRNDIEVIFMPIVCGKRFYPFVVDSRLSVSVPNFYLL